MSKILALVLTVTALWAAVALAQTGQAPSNPAKLTTLGKYCTAMEAYLMWRAKPKEVTILDVRTPEEYSFVGHAEMALNIPVSLFNAKFNAETKRYGMDDNPDFTSQVSMRLGKNDTILVMCRNGERTAPAVNKLAQAGFTNVYSVVDSFEGDAVTDPESVYNGKRMKNGWKNYGLPWTYSLNPDLVWSK
ncbi:rhodanese-like domain-containing protein [Fundidesulfovibrio terrae]|uniref:rhodanese-like domain-containing protein n=1 Tax=Fundidesulfovibrio terrae TaxID=2922866 RepID=UPI001FB0089A|nr:rhodanese-like domain-containing protein [Fundidesulfovibrio terrae]